MRLYCKHQFIYQKLTGFHIRAFVFLSLSCSNFRSFVLVIVKIWLKRSLSQLSVNHSSGHLIEFNVSESMNYTSGNPTFACSFIVMSGDCHMTQYDLDLWHSGAKMWLNMAVTRVCHSCLLIELGPICNCMAASLRSAMAGRLYNVHAKHTSNSGFDRTFMPCSGYFY